MRASSGRDMPRSVSEKQPERNMMNRPALVPTVTAIHDRSHPPHRAGVTGFARLNGREPAQPSRYASRPIVWALRFVLMGVVTSPLRIQFRQEVFMGTQTSPN